MTIYREFNAIHDHLKVIKDVLDFKASASSLVRSLPNALEFNLKEIYLV